MCGPSRLEWDKGEWLIFLLLTQLTFAVNEIHLESKEYVGIVFIHTERHQGRRILECLKRGKELSV